MHNRAKDVLGSVSSSHMRFITVIILNLTPAVPFNELQHDDHGYLTQDMQANFPR
jgi:hypothetical protein